MKKDPYDFVHEYIISLSDDDLRDFLLRHERELVLDSDAILRIMTFNRRELLSWLWLRNYSFFLMLGIQLKKLESI